MIERYDVNEEWAHCGIIKAGDFCFLNYCVGNVGGSIEQQVNGAFDEMEKRLALVGLTLENVVQMDCLFRDIWDIPVMEKVIKERFGGKYPVRKSIQTEFAHFGGENGLKFQADAVVIMKFCDNVKKERRAKGLTQQQFADMLGVSLRTITNYEKGESYPKQREIYGKMAEILGVDINYLLTENEEFYINANEKYGATGAQQAKALMQEATGLFAGGELDQDDMDEMMKAIQDAYWIAKEKNRKYVSKRKEHEC